MGVIIYPPGIENHEEKEKEVRQMKVKSVNLCLMFIKFLSTSAQTLL